MYNDFDIFENVMSPGMNAKINYKAHLQKRLIVFCRFCLQIFQQNGLIWLLKYFIKKSRCVPKNTEIWRGFEVRWNFCCKISLLKKVKVLEHTDEKMINYETPSLLYTDTFCWNTFAIYSTFGFIVKFCVFDTHKKICVILAYFSNFKGKRRRNSSKTPQNFFCGRESGIELRVYYPFTVYIKIVADWFFSCIQWEAPLKNIVIFWLTRKRCWSFIIK